MKKELAFQFRQEMFDAFRAIETHKDKYVTNPGKDFTRMRKLSMSETMTIVASIEGNSLNYELHDYQTSGNRPAEKYITTSGFVQQRGKIKWEAFRDAFELFNKATVEYDAKTFKGYHIYAIDGTCLNIAKNPESETYVDHREDAEGYNQFHINTTYDVLNKTYVAAVIQPQPKTHEPEAARMMVRGQDPDVKTINTYDRGYGGYDLMATIGDECHQKFCIRINTTFKEVQELPDAECDKDINLLIMQTQTNESKMLKQLPNTRRLVGPSKFGKNIKDVSWYHGDRYHLNYRLVKFKVGETWETLATNLTRDEFSINDLKELYHLRWGVETSYRELKYAVGLVNLHSRTEKYIKQEIFAKMMVYNFCSRITNTVVIAQKEENIHEYKVNFVQAIHICVTFLKHLKQHGVAEYIKKYVSPYRPGRSDERKIKPKTAVFFVYRVA